MATSITNYQCPSCTGPLHFVGESGRLECDYCGSSFSVQEIEALYADKEEASVQAQAAAAAEEEKWEQQMQEETQWEQSTEMLTNSDGMKLKSYNCPSCGAELVCDETTAATSCPYCGNPSIIPGQFTQMLKPDYVLPFKLDKEAAVSALKKYYGGKRLLPKCFSDQNHIEEIKGVYVPFWLFDGEIDVDMRFAATKSFAHVRGNQRITTTEHYNVRRAGTVPFKNIPADGSSKMPDEHMDAIEPFDFSELKQFSTAYLPGYLADKYDVSSDECSERALKRAENSAVGIVGSSVSGYATCVPQGQSVRTRRGRVKYALLPVWMLSTRWNGKSFLFAMNGQTGKLIGDLPVDMGRFWKMFAAIAAPITAVIYLLLG